MKVIRTIKISALVWTTLAVCAPAATAQVYVGEAVFPDVAYSETFYPFDPDAGMQIEVTCTGTSSWGLSRMVVGLSPPSMSFNIDIQRSNVTGTHAQYCFDSEQSFPFSVANVSATAVGVSGQNNAGTIFIDLFFNGDRSLLEGTVLSTTNFPGQESGDAILAQNLVELDLDTAGDGLIMLDRSSGLEWLDLTVTLGNSILDTEADASIFGPFRWATESEILGLFENIYSPRTAGDIINRNDAGEYVQVADLINMLGPSFTSPIQFLLQGVSRGAEVAPSQFGLGFIRVFRDSDVHWDSWSPSAVCCFSETSAHGGVGSWLVRDANSRPVADAGIDQLVIVGTEVSLDGSASTDPDSDPLSYSWTISSAPVGSTAALSGADSESPALITDLEGVYEVTLVVSDLVGPGTPDSVAIMAIAADEFAMIELVSAGEVIFALEPEQVTTSGNQNALMNFLSQAAAAIGNGELTRTDGCTLRGAPDGDGPGRDWITDCVEQIVVYDSLNSALMALAP